MGFIYCFHSYVSNFWNIDDVVFYRGLNYFDEVFMPDLSSGELNDVAF